MEATSGLSLREAARRAGVSHTKVGDLKKWHDAGGNPAELVIESGTLEKLSTYLLVADNIGAAQVALKLAAARLRSVAEQFELEAASPTASETVQHVLSVLGPIDEAETPNGEEDLGSKAG